MNEKLLQSAYALVDKNISVIPVGKDKKPIPRFMWKEFQNRYATHDEIKGWFEKYPDAQLAIITGKISNLSVVDVEFGGDTSYLPQNTAIVATGGLGYHYYYKYCPGLQNKVKIRELTDVRSEGGYVLAPGSVSDKGPYELIQELPTIPFPIHLFSETERASKVYTQPSTVNQSNFDVEDYPGYGQGMRNDMMTRYVGLVLASMHPAKWDTIAWNVIKTANYKNTPPLPDSELLAIFNSIKNREIISAPDKWSKKSEEKLQREKEILTDDSLGLISEVAAAQNAELDVKIPIQTGFKTIDETLKGGVRVGDVVTISGETGQGKTTLALNILINMAERGESVTLLTYEMFVAEMWEKLQEAKVSDDIRIYTPRCHTSGRIDWVKQKIDEGKKYGIRVIVIDHLEFLTSDDKFAKNVNMNFSNKVAETMKEVKNLARNEGVCIILLCHLTKIQQGSRPTIGNLKDTASIGQESDSVLLIERIKTVNPTNDDDIYSPISVVSVQKSRRNGKSKYIEMIMTDGRFYETEKFNIDRKNAEAKEVHGETNKEEENSPIQGLLDMGFGFSSST